MSVFDKHRDTLEHHETMMGTRARPAGRRARSAHRFARAGRPARRVLPQRTVSRASRDGHRARARTARRRQAAGAERDGGTATKLSSGSADSPPRALPPARSTSSRPAVRSAARGLLLQRDRISSHSSAGHAEQRAERRTTACAATSRRDRARSRSVARDRRRQRHERQLGGEHPAAEIDPALPSAAAPC